MDKKNLAPLAAVGIAAAAIGLGAGSLIWGSSEPAEEHAEEQHADDEHADDEGAGTSPEGFVALPLGDASKAGVQVTTIGRGGGAELLVPGRAAFAPGAEASIGAPLSGLVETVHVATGSNVRAGTPLVTLRSGEGASLRASADAARAKVEAARAANRREARLFAERVTARQDLEASRAAALMAEADLRAAEAQVAAVGSPSSAGRTTVRSPMAGTVTALTVSPGVVLTQGASVAQVANQNRVELLFEAPAAASRTIRVGSSISATMAGGQEIAAVVIAVTPHANDAGVQVRARPVSFIPPVGTPVSGRVITDASNNLVVPSDAVQTVGGRPVVFVVQGQGFRAVPVVAGRVSAGRTEILRGLRGDERIAGRGAFLLKAELSRGEAEHEH